MAFMRCLLASSSFCRPSLAWKDHRQLAGAPFSVHGAIADLARQHNGSTAAAAITAVPEGYTKVSRTRELCALGAGGMANEARRSFCRCRGRRCSFALIFGRAIPVATLAVSRSPAVEQTVADWAGAASAVLLPQTCRTVFASVADLSCLFFSRCIAVPVPVPATSIPSHKPGAHMPSGPRRRSCSSERA